MLFFQAVWSKIQRACQRKMREREKWGDNRRIDRATAGEQGAYHVYLHHCYFCGLEQIGGGGGVFSPVRAGYERATT